MKGTKSNKKRAMGEIAQGKTCRGGLESNMWAQGQVYLQQGKGAEERREAKSTQLVLAFKSQLQQSGKQQQSELNM